MNTEANFIATFEENGTRLDKFLTLHFSGQLSRNCIQDALRNGRVICNGVHELKPNYRVKSGDQIHVRLEEKPVRGLVPCKRDITFVYEDEFLLVVDKPEGLVVHPGHGVEPGTTLVEALLSHCPLSRAAGVDRPGVVHRIDKATSGLLLLAKTYEAYGKLTRLFANREIHKVYHALVCGIPSLCSGSIELPIGRCAKDRTAMCVCSKGRYALTQWTLKESFRSAHKALLECEPKTGRTHQIRVHLQWMGHAIVGDEKYGHTVADRLFLHAYQLNFEHPITHVPLAFQSDWPASFRKEIQRLRSLELTPLHR